ncbi:hypothetical protein M9H77_08555 [Catharanthus roseus]|uniref:Uncharacterized protein n=1 Tax=Catharanthus roseus TaxID=4058 RepID=A0ACC0BY80_CATRO|nr:hypothetical protein M9H77_08555 [Catharanthus roseus]
MEALGRAISRERIGWATRARLCALGLAIKRNGYGWAVNNFDHCSLDKLGILLLELPARLKVSMSATNGVPPRWSVVAILAHASADRPLCVSFCCYLAVPRPEDGRDLPRHRPFATAILWCSAVSATATKRRPGPITMPANYAVPG